MVVVLLVYVIFKPTTYS